MKKVIDELGGFKALATFLQQTAARAENERNAVKPDSLSLYFDGKAEAFRLAARWLNDELENYRKGIKSIWP